MCRRTWEIIETREVGKSIKHQDLTLLASSPTITPTNNFQTPKMFAIEIPIATCLDHGRTQGMESGVLRGYDCPLTFGRPLKRESLWAQSPPLPPIWVPSLSFAGRILEEPDQAPFFLTTGWMRVGKSDLHSKMGGQLGNSYRLWGGPGAKEQSMAPAGHRPPSSCPRLHARIPDGTAHESQAQVSGALTTFPSAQARKVSSLYPLESKLQPNSKSHCSPHSSCMVCCLLLFPNLFSHKLEDSSEINFSSSYFT